MAKKIESSKRLILVGALVLGTSLLAGCGGGEDQPTSSEQPAADEVEASQQNLCFGTAYTVLCGANPYKVCWGRKFTCQSSCFPLSGSYYKQVYCF